MTMNDVYKVGGGLLVGAALGGAAGMLLAPKSGKETREDIKAKAVEVQEKTQAVIEETKERAGEMYEKSRDAVAEQRERAMEAINSGREMLMGKGEEMAEDVEAKAGAVASKAKAAKPSAAAS